MTVFSYLLIDNCKVYKFKSLQLSKIIHNLKIIILLLVLVVHIKNIFFKLNHHLINFNFSNFNFATI